MFIKTQHKGFFVFLQFILTSYFCAGSFLILSEPKGNWINPAQLEAIEDKKLKIMSGEEIPFEVVRIDPDNEKAGCNIEFDLLEQRISIPMRGKLDPGGVYCSFRIKDPEATQWSKFRITGNFDLIRLSKACNEEELLTYLFFLFVTQTATGEPNCNWIRVTSSELENFLDFVDCEPKECLEKINKFVEEIAGQRPDLNIPYEVSFLDLAVRILLYELNEGRKRNDNEIYSMLKKIDAFYDLTASRMKESHLYRPIANGFTDFYDTDIKDLLMKLLILITPRRIEYLTYTNYDFCNKGWYIGKDDPNTLSQNFNKLAGYLRTYLWRNNRVK